MAVTTMSFSNSLFLLILVCIILMNRHEGCLQEEREGLLQIRTFLKSNVALDSDDLFPTWVGDGCCEWERVLCDNTTGHVIELSLNSLEQLSNEIYKSWTLDVSQFMPFKDLRTLNLSDNYLRLLLDNQQGSEGLSSLRKLEILDLSSNFFDDKVSMFGALGAITSLKTLTLSHCRLEGYFPAHELVALEYLEKLDISVNRYNGSLPLQGFERLSVMKKMESLNLDSNEFSNSILPSLGALVSLKLLNLGNNAFTGSFPTQELRNLSNLEVLFLNNNLFNATQSMQGLTSFRRLEILDLSSNRFVGNIPSSIGTLSSLKALSLAGNELTSSPTLLGLCELRKLEELDLSKNIFEGVIPPCLSSLTSLRLFDLSGNQFTGNLSSSLIANLTSLEYIDLSENRLEGLLSFNSFANHTKLEVVAFSGNNNLELETESSIWIPKFQLKVISLSNCNLNRLLGGAVPKFLVHQRELRLLDLSHNSLQGAFPNWLLKNNTKLEVINLRNNSFSGLFHLMPCQYAKTWLVDISSNHLHGRIQANMWQMLPNLYYLNLSRNAFFGDLPFSICKSTELTLLDLSFNSFSEEVPTHMFTDCLSLTVLKLSDNKFRGQILETNFTPSQLSILSLENNMFTGKLPKIFPESFEGLEMIDISNNLFSGAVPSWISNLTLLTSLSMQNNFFEGQFPGDFSVDLQFLDISQNKFSGSLPLFSNIQFDSNWNLYNLKHLHLESNRFTGSFPNSYRYLSSLLILDISDNNLSGAIPDFLGELSNLRILLLRRNNFSGLIPRQLCRLSNISMIDLSSNSLVGSIPYCLQGIAPPSRLGFIQESPFGFGRTQSYKYGSSLQRSFEFDNANDMYDEETEVDFVTKHMSGTYKGTILNLMSGLDLSCNNLTGEIPQELGLLNQIHALNLSHNQLTGTIPRRFSNLTQLESLDLSFNSLSGEIPSVLIVLHFLEVFVVAQNNLSGRVPELKAQFTTFSKDAYEGNPFLCGPPLEKTCTPLDHSPLSSRASIDEIQEKWYDIDLDSFFSSLAATSTVFFLGSVAILFINPYWRQRWLHFIEDCIFACYYFLSDSIHKLLSFCKFWETFNVKKVGEFKSLLQRI